MRDVPLFRRLTVILVMGLFFLGGCLGRSQSPRFIRLSPITEDKAMAKSDTPARDTRIGIGPIKLADYLDQSKLVTRTGDNRLVKAEFDLWAGAFKDNLTNVLAENIGLLCRPNAYTFIPGGCPSRWTIRSSWMWFGSMVIWEKTPGWWRAGASSEARTGSCSRWAAPASASR
jgi:hypothetical protein